MKHYIELLTMASEKSNPPEFMYKIVICSAKECAAGENIKYIGSVHIYQFNDCKEVTCESAFIVDIAKNNLGITLYAEEITIKHICLKLMSLWEDGIKSG